MYDNLKIYNLRTQTKKTFCRIYFVESGTWCCVLRCCAYWLGTRHVTNSFYSFDTALDVLQPLK